MKKIILLLQCSLITTAILFFGGCRNTSAVRQAPTLASSSVNTWVPATNNAEKPRHIALLLPLSGPYQTYANAIRNGFFTEYYAQKQQTGYVPNITVFNTQDKNILDVYHTAISQGADFIVGPLNKPNVMLLATTGTSAVTTLALNATPDNVPITNQSLYEFALSPTDEAQQAAIKAQQDQHHRVIILAPQNALGSRMVNAFATQWQQQGGTITATSYYQKITSLSKNISAVLGIQDAYQNARALKNTLHENFRFIPERRQDFDSLFVVANSKMAKQISPLLQFYFAGNIPTYATSQIYSLHNNTDLDGILFCNIPWILQPNTFASSQEKIKMLWPDNYPHLSKFYAMGVDAFTLASQFKQLQAHPNTGLPAATGTLYLTPQHYIYRKLLWAKISNGRAIVIGGQ